MATNNGYSEGTTISPAIDILNTTRPTLPVPVLVCTGISGSLSMLGAFIIFFSFCILDRKHLNQTRWLLLWLTIADFMNCTGIVLGLVRYILTYSGQVEAESDCLNSNSLCVIQSFITTFSSMSSFFWTVYIGIHLSVSVVKQGEFATKRSIQIVGHLICWVGITIAAKIENVLGETFSASSGPWCWIRDCLEFPLPIIWMTIAGKGWEIIMIWGTTRFVLTIVRHYYDTLPAFDLADTILLYFQSIGDSLQAFFNCILFCFVDKTVRKALISRFTCKNNVDAEETRGLLENSNASRYT
ncbi:hypothetical protein KUTeg_024025, partial [Tegillarca granosa]